MLRIFILLFLAQSFVNIIDAAEFIKQADKDRYLSILDELEAMLKMTEHRELWKKGASSIYPFVDIEFKDERQELLKSISNEFMSVPIEPDELKACFEEMKKKKDNLPPIEIVGELHGCPNCHLDKVNRALDAREKKHAYASEGPDARDENAKGGETIEEAEGAQFPKIILNLPTSGIYNLGLEGFGKDLTDLSDLVVIGFEEPHTQILKATVESPSIVRTNFYSDAMVSIWQLLIGTSNSLHIQSIRKLSLADSGFRKEFGDPFLETAKEIIAKVEKGITINEALGEWEFFFKKFTYGSLKQNIEKLILAELKSVAEDSPDFNKKYPEFSRLLEKKELNQSEWELLNKIFKHPIKNREYAYNTLTHYCREAFPKEKPLVIVSGGSHAAAIKFLVENALMNLDVPLPTIMPIRNDLKYLNMPYPERKEELIHGLELLKKRLQSTH